MNSTWFTWRHAVILLAMKFQSASWMPFILISSSLLQTLLLYPIIMSSHQEQPSISGKGLILFLLLSVCYNIYYHWCGMNYRKMNGIFLIIKKILKCWHTFGWMPQVLNMRCVEWGLCLQCCLAENACELECTALNASSMCACLSQKIGQQEISAGSCFQSCKWHAQRQTCLRCHLPTERKTKWK